MTTRTRTETVTFRQPFVLEGVARSVPVDPAVVEAALTRDRAAGGPARDAP